MEAFFFLSKTLRLTECNRKGERNSALLFGVKNSQQEWKGQINGKELIEAIWEGSVITTYWNLSIHD